VTEFERLVAVMIVEERLSAKDCIRIRGSLTSTGLTQFLQSSICTHLSALTADLSLPVSGRVVWNTQMAGGRLARGVCTTSTMRRTAPSSQKDHPFRYLAVDLSRETIVLVVDNKML